MAHKSLAPGIRFHPTDVELIKYYLQKKVTGKHICFDVISEVDVYKFSPSDLPDKSLLKSTDLEWYFFCPRERKYANGARMNRATEYGYWKTTGRDRPIKYNHRTVGMIKTLIYHEGRAPHGNRTDWVMHEYRLEDEDLSKSGVAQDAYVICKIFLKSGPGPRSTQHLFKEEDWIDGDDDGTSLDECPLNGLSFPSALNLINPGSSTVTNPCNPGSISIDASIEAGPSASVTFLKAADSDKYNILLSELPNSPKEFPSLMNTQKDVSLSELPQASNSNVYEMLTSTNYKQCQVGMHGNPCSFPELSNDAMFSTWEMHGGDNHMLPSRSHREEVEHLPDINRGGMVQSSTLAHPDVYNELGNLFDLGVDALNDDSFIELDDLSNPLGDEPHWSHLIPSDDLLSGVDPHLNRVSSFHPVDEYGGSFCDNAPAESLLLPGSSLGSIGHTDIQQKVSFLISYKNVY
uniref:NAC domain-containing protein n=1 Tax=Kalanchoe fedtschenkoi TaxID=63787 RepID=A0A7N0TRN1_KALFE